MNQQYGGMNNGMMNMMQATQNPMMQQAANDPVLATSQLLQLPMAPFPPL